jgi:anti-anti-sigma regulatory factor
VNESLVTAPAHLGAGTRIGFREDAVAALTRLNDAEPGGCLVIDLAATRRLDSSGLGVLVWIQLRAAERRHGVTLRGASEEIRFLLLMTKLEARFIIEV